MKTDRDHIPKPNVFLVQTPSVPKHTGKIIDTSPLNNWGTVHTLIGEKQYPSYKPAEMLRQIHDRLTAWKFDPDRDYIAVAGGDSVGVLLVGATLANMGVEYFQYLRFDRDRLPNGGRDPASGRYVPITIPTVLGQMAPDEDAL